MPQPIDEDLLETEVEDGPEFEDIPGEDYEEELT
jgi:hypothetical protein